LSFCFVLSERLGRNQAWRSRAGKQRQIPLIGSEDAKAARGGYQQVIPSLEEASMRMARPAKDRLARGACIAGAAAGLVAGLIAGPAPNAGRARAQGVGPAAVTIAAPAETWVCTDAASSSDPSRLPLELLLKDGVLSEQPFGVPRYQLLANTPFAIIGEHHFGDVDPVLGMVSIFVATMMIDRTTGSFTATTSVSGSPLQQRTGRCRRFEERRSATDGALARR
jgi:hypothetical protein